MINFNDIVCIEVFKDVFVIVIYGVCVVNGVVLIIIKCGEEGIFKIFYNVYYVE